MAVTDEGDWHVVAEAPKQGEGLLEGNCYANARLIAAAPDLLKAAKQARMILESLWSRHRQKESTTFTNLENAISKAEGSDYD